MDQQHHRSRPSGHGVARLGEVTDQLQTIARRHDDRPHRHQRRAFERRPAREQPTHLAAGAVVVEEASRRAGRFGIAHPARTVVGHAEPAELALARADDPLEIGRGGLIDHLPAPFAVDDRRGDRRAAHRIENRLAEIGLRILGQDAEFAGGKVLRHHGGPIAALAIEPVEFLAVVGDLDHRGGVGILRLDAAEQRTRSLTVQLDDIPAAVGAIAAAPAGPELRIGEDPGEAVVLVDKRAFTRGDVDAIDVEVALVALVMGEQQLAGKARRGLLDEGQHAGSRRQGADVAGLDVDAMGLPVLVAALLAEEHDMAVVVRPPQSVAARRGR